MRAPHDIFLFRYFFQNLDCHGNNFRWVDNSGYPPPNKAISVYYHI